MKRHFIRGSEAGRARPMAYMRRGRTRRSRSARPPASRPLLHVTLAAAAALVLILLIQAGVPG